MLIVTNGEPLGQAITRIVHRTLGEDMRVFRLTYSECVSQLTKELLRQTDFLILELLRQYPGGLRAEGLTLAQRLAKTGKSALIVSPLYLARQLNCGMYWDASSADYLSARIQHQLLASRPDSAEIEHLVKRFAPLLALPQQHNS